MKLSTRPAADSGHAAGEDTRKPRSDGEQSRERLLLAAMRLFAEQGYAKTSTRAIALAAGANVAAIRYYFGDKANLYRALFNCRPAGIEHSPALFDPAEVPLRQSLTVFYDELLVLLKQGDMARLYLRLWFRELLEPTGLWQQELDEGIRPMHMALVALLARHVGVAPAQAAGDDDLHRLAYAVAGLGMQLMMARDVISEITPQLIASGAAVDLWATRLVGYAEAMVGAEQQRRSTGTA
jgi:AcrR family transcriptional regulator